MMHEYESWIIKKAECRRIHAFELWFWRRLLRVPWTARRSNQSIFFFSPLYLFILLNNIVLVLPYIDLNLPWVYLCSPSWTPLPPPSPSHPSGSSQCTSPERLVSCIEPGLAICFTYDNYMFQCHSPISSLSCPLPQSPKDCLIHLCLFCCLTYRVIVTIFLNSIYMH